MAIEIKNNGASIRFIGNAAEKLVMKHTIKNVSVIRQESIRIDMDETLKNIAFRHSDVTEPVTSNAVILAAAINAMITACVCCECNSEQPND
ncbi:MAG: hypothetical protein ABI675_15175 [Chitinophagaceae bacterium]